MRTMKDSGIEWIGDIPSDWDVQRLQYSLREINVDNNPIKTEQILSLVKDKGVMPYEEKGDVGNKAKEDISEYKLAYPNTLVLNSMNILIGSVGISKYMGCVSPVYYVFKETEESDLRFINYIFNTREFQKELRKYANGILEIRLRVSAYDIFKRKVALPSKQEQQQIADYLDIKCGQIDGLIENITRQIENLEEYKKSVITQAVTKGLNPAAEMKDSGVFYLGIVNKDWRKTKIGYVCSKLYRRFNADDTPLICSNKGKILKRDESASGIMVSEDNAMQGIRKGDIAIHGMDTWHGAIAYSDFDGKITRVVHVCDSSEEKRFIVYYLQYLAYQGVYKLISNGVRGNTSDFRSWEKVKDIYIYVPQNKNEQIDICDFLDNKCIEIENLINVKNNQIQTLEEYKKSLIFEYVTGKKDIKEVALQVTKAN